MLLFVFYCPPIAVFGLTLTFSPSPLYSIVFSFSDWYLLFSFSYSIVALWHLFFLSSTRALPNLSFLDIFISLSLSSGSFDYLPGDILWCTPLTINDVVLRWLWYCSYSYSKSCYWALSRLIKLFMSSRWSCYWRRLLTEASSLTIFKCFFFEEGFESSSWVSIARRFKRRGKRI